MLSAISMTGGDGVAAVSRMLGTILQENWAGECDVVTLFQGAAHRASTAEKARFAATIAAAQVAGRSRWTLFTHANLLRVLGTVPPRLRRPYAVFLHGIEAWGPLSPRDLTLLGNARLRLANSRFTASRVMAAHPDIGPVIACPLALPPPTDDETTTRKGPDGAGLAPSVQETPPDVGKAAVLIVGRMLAAERYKGHDQLIDAWPRVLQLVPNAQLFVVGHGDDVQRLRGRAEQAGLGDSVVFTGFVSAAALQSLYERCRVFAMPSRAEGFGLVYLEAMSRGLPCVGCHEDAAAEVIADGETGLLVHHDNVPALADAIVRLLSDRALCARLGDAGAQRVRDVFSFDRFARQVVGCLRAAFKEWPTATRVYPGART